MYTSFSRLWLRSQLLWIAGFAIWLLTAATSLVPERVNDDMVERAVRGAEWLAEQAMQAPETRNYAAYETDLTSWLLISSDAFGLKTAAFTEALVETGYGDSEIAISAWIKEFTHVLTADEANQHRAELRPMSEIQFELDSLPTPPPDEETKEYMDRLFDELLLSSVPHDALMAVTKAEDRISVLQELFKRETGR